MTFTINGLRKNLQAAEAEVRDARAHLADAIERAERLGRALEAWSVVADDLIIRRAKIRRTPALTDEQRAALQRRGKWLQYNNKRAKAGLERVPLSEFRDPLQDLSDLVGDTQ